MKLRPPITRQQIGERQNVRWYFRAQYAASKHAGLVAELGAQGVYLIKPPSKVRSDTQPISRDVAPIGCVSKTAYQKCLDCPYATKAHCPLQHVMGGVRNAIADILDNYSLEDFISGMHGSRRSPVHRKTARR